MKLSRRIGAATVALAVGAGLTLGLGPAQGAGAPVPTALVIQGLDQAKVQYGDYVSLFAEPTDVNGGLLDSSDGTVTINARPLGATTWTAVGTEPSGFASYQNTAIAQSTQYQATYSGGTGYDDDGNQITLAPSTSAIVTVVVGRGELLVKNTKKIFCYKVGPKPYKNKPVYHYGKAGKAKKWRLDYVEHTNKKSEICYRIHKGKTPKHVKLPKGPKHGAIKTVYVKTGGMKKTVYIDKY